MNGDRQLARLDAARAQLDATHAILRVAQRDLDDAVREFTTAASAIAERVRLIVDDDEQRAMRLPLTATRARGER